MRNRTSIAALGAALLLAGAGRAEPLQVVASVPDLGSLCESVGGDAVQVTVLAKGPQDPHFVEPRPSFVRRLHDAELWVQQGMDLEIGWAPALLRSARNPRVMPGGPGHLDASSVVAPLEVPAAGADRSTGDLHPYGNPHYLSDPLHGLRVARLLRDKLSELRPEGAPHFAAGYEAFAGRLAEALLGSEWVAAHGADRVRGELERGELGALLESPGDTPLGGWLGAVRDLPGRKAVQEHRLWPYFARRFGLELVATLEPLPGIAPTTRHLAAVIERMQAEGVRWILSTPYFDNRHARFVAERTGATVLDVAHQVGARPGTGDYIAMIDYNVRLLTGAP